MDDAVDAGTGELGFCAWGHAARSRLMYNRLSASTYDRVDAQEFTLWVDSIPS